MQIVVLSQVLACDATLGYEEMHNTQVLRFNGTKIRNLAHLAELTTTCTQPFMRFDLDLDVSHPTLPLLPLACATSVTLLHLLVGVQPHRAYCYKVMQTRLVETAGIGTDRVSHACRR